MEKQVFRIGDRVIVSTYTVGTDKQGAVGSIIGHEESTIYPYKVEFTPDHYEFFGESSLVHVSDCEPIELEHVKKGDLYRVISDTTDTYLNTAFRVDEFENNVATVEVVHGDLNPLWPTGVHLQFDLGHGLAFMPLIKGHPETLQYEDIDPEEATLDAGELTTNEDGTFNVGHSHPAGRMERENMETVMEAVDAYPSQDYVADTFVKLDDGKPELKYILDTPLASAEKCRVRKFGDKKYDRFNWYKCDDPERYLSAALRHLHAIAEDPNAIDEESGLPHRAHALCSLEFYNELVARQQKGIK